MKFTDLTIHKKEETLEGECYRLYKELLPQLARTQTLFTGETQNVPAKAGIDLEIVTANQIQNFIDSPSRKLSRVNRQFLNRLKKMKQQNNVNFSKLGGYGYGKIL